MSAVHAADIAGKLLDAGRADEALAFFEEHASQRTYASLVPLPKIKSRILVALGRREDAALVLWKAFTGTLSESLLADALELTPEEHRPALEQQALDTAASYDYPERGLGFLVDRGALDRAAALVDERVGEMTGYNYYALADAAKALADAHPRQSWELLRILLTDILDSGRSKAYRHAARYLRDMKGRADEGGFVAEHDAFVVQIEDAHKRKRSFWKLVK